VTCNAILLQGIMACEQQFPNGTRCVSALSFNGEELCYRKLNEQSNQMAHALLQSGCKSEDRIGIFLHKGLELGVADCGIKSIVSSDALQSVINDLPAECKLQKVFGVESQLIFDQLSWKAITALPTLNPELPTIDQHPGYIMYTSGSTGEPKGMIHTHASSNCYAEWGRHHVRLTANDRVASHAPLHFDLSIFDFFSTLRAGATVVLVPEPVTRFPASWTSYIESERISVVFTVPYTLITMPAEAPSCTCYDIPVPFLCEDESLPIGNMSLNSTALIIDEDDNECTVGEPGELCVRSSTLTSGYSLAEKIE